VVSLHTSLKYILARRFAIRSLIERKKPSEKRTQNCYNLVIQRRVKSRSVQLTHLTDLTGSGRECLSLLVSKRHPFPTGATDKSDDFASIRVDGRKH
jgi:hypothetical protein